MALSITSSDVLVDALPYIDQGYDEPGVKEAVLAMIEEETKRYKPTKNYLEHLPAIELHEFETELMKNEMERMERGQPMEMFSMKRYELPSPSGSKLTDVQAWSEALDNSYAQLQHQSIRLVNLDLMNKYGAEAWKKYNDQLSSMLTECQKQLQELRKEIQEINWQRKNSQTAAGEKLKLLEANWVSLVSKNFEIERACVELENELKMKAENPVKEVPESKAIPEELSKMIPEESSNPVSEQQSRTQDAEMPNDEGE